MTEAAVDKRFYLDDLNVGQRFVSRTHLIDAEQIKAFAGQFDPQPFHLDEELAKDTLFGHLAASGWHTAAITMRLLVRRRVAACWRNRWCRRRHRLAQTDAAR
jgi:acyl dehydratase